MRPLVDDQSTAAGCQPCPYFTNLILTPDKHRAGPTKGASAISVMRFNQATPEMLRCRPGGVSTSPRLFEADAVSLGGPGMRERIRRLATLAVMEPASNAAITFAAPEANSSPCQALWSWNPATNECTPPPPPGPPATIGRPIPPPPWYPAPPWAPPTVPLPPPTPVWAPQDKSPVWDPGHKQWGNLDRPGLGAGVERNKRWDSA